jgi:hypothetical protein
LISTHLFLFFSFSSSSISNGAFRCHILLRLILYSRCEHWRLVSAGPFQHHPMCQTEFRMQFCPNMIETAVLVILSPLQSSDQSMLKVTTSTSVIYNIGQLAMIGSCLVTESCHDDVLGRQAQRFVRGPTDMSLVKHVCPFRMMLLHLALCCHRIHEFLIDISATSSLNTE